MFQVDTVDDAMVRGQCIDERPQLKAQRTITGPDESSCPAKSYQQVQHHMENLILSFEHETFIEMTRLRNPSIHAAAL